MLEMVDTSFVVKCPKKISVHAALSVNCASFSMESSVVGQGTPSRHGTRVFFPISLARTEMALRRVLPAHIGIWKKMKGREREGLEQAFVVGSFLGTKAHWTILHQVLLWI